MTSTYSYRTTLQSTSELMKISSIELLTYIFFSDKCCNMFDFLKEFHQDNKFHNYDYFEVAKKV